MIERSFAPAVVATAIAVLVDAVTLPMALLPRVCPADGPLSQVSRCYLERPTVILVGKPPSLDFRLSANCSEWCSRGHSRNRTNITGFYDPSVHLLPSNGDPNSAGEVPSTPRCSDLLGLPSTRLTSFTKASDPLFPLDYLVGLSDSGFCTDLSSLDCWISGFFTDLPSLGLFHWAPGYRTPSSWVYTVNTSGDNPMDCSGFSGNALHPFIVPRL